MFLAYMGATKSVAIVATHDSELAISLATLYDQYHFSDDADVDGLHFDYMLRSGSATTTNAIQTA